MPSFERHVQHLTTCPNSGCRSELVQQEGSIEQVEGAKGLFRIRLRCPECGDRWFQDRTSGVLKAFKREQRRQVMSIEKCYEASGRSNMREYEEHFLDGLRNL